MKQKLKKGKTKKREKRICRQVMRIKKKDKEIQKETKMEKIWKREREKWSERRDGK